MGVVTASINQQLRFSDIADVLKLGLNDFLNAPLFGLFFSGVYVVSGLVLVQLSAGHVSWVLAISLGFPLIAPFAAAGLYDVSRRREAGLPLNWSAVLTGVWQERKRQLPLLGGLIIVYFLFWTFLAHMIFALFMGRVTMTNVSSSWDIFLTPNGMMMLTVGGAIGAVLALLLFAMTVISLPMVVDQEVDFITAMIRSVQTVLANPFVMLLWAAIIAVTTLVALVPWFLGLLVVLPVLGHATWHMYRRCVSI